MARNQSIFVFEWFAANGSGSAGNDDWLSDGLSMLNSLVLDILRIGGWDVHCCTPRNLLSRLPNEAIVHERELSQSLDVQIGQILKNVDHSIVIAPETDRILEDCLGLISETRATLLSPDIDFVRLTGNKFETAQYLTRNCVRCLPGKILNHRQPGDDDCSFPIVIKPVTGAGSGDTFFLEKREQLDPFLAQESQSLGPDRAWLIQPWIPGIPASVSVLAGSESIVLTPMEQLFDRHPIGRIVGVRPLQNEQQRKRASELAAKVANTLPSTQGYFGIDMILGNDATGRADFVVEVNPRLTTSYTELSKLNQQNLAKTMLDNAIAAGPSRGFCTPIHNPTR